MLMLILGYELEKIGCKKKIIDFWGKGKIDDYFYAHFEICGEKVIDFMEKRENR